jgi:hypothetical protein
VDSTAEQLPMSTRQLLLERYVEAKDFTRPHLMREIYAPDAVLTFSIATDSISFPEKVAGIDGITRTLIVDFGAKYNRCRTYYVCDSLPEHTDRITIVPWLVLMHEAARAVLRVGKGYYVWTFEPQGPVSVQVVAMHIHIERMDPVDDADGHLLSAAQAVLPYPWLPPSVMRSRLGTLSQSDPALAFLGDFRVPIDPPEPRPRLSQLARP